MRFYKFIRIVDWTRCLMLSVGSTGSELSDVCFSHTILRIGRLYITRPSDHNKGQHLIATNIRQLKQDLSKARQDLKDAQLNTTDLEPILKLKARIYNFEYELKTITKDR